MVSVSFAFSAVISTNSFMFKVLNVEICWHVQAVIWVSTNLRTWGLTVFWVLPGTTTTSQNQWLFFATHGVRKIWVMSMWILTYRNQVYNFQVEYWNGTKIVWSTSLLSETWANHKVLWVNSDLQWLPVACKNSKKFKYVLDYRLEALLALPSL